MRVGAEVDVFVVVQVQDVVDVDGCDAVRKVLIDGGDVLPLRAFPVVLAHALRQAELGVVRHDHVVDLHAGQLIGKRVDHLGVGRGHAVVAVEHFKALVVVDADAGGHVALGAVVVDRWRRRLRRGRRRRGGRRLCGRRRCGACTGGGVRRCEQGAAEDAAPAEHAEAPQDVHDDAERGDNQEDDDRDHRGPALFGRGRGPARCRRPGRRRVVALRVCGKLLRFVVVGGLRRLAARRLLGRAAAVMLAGHVFCH